MRDSLFFVYFLFHALFYFVLGSNYTFSVQFEVDLAHFTINEV